MKQHRQSPTTTGRQPKASLVLAALYRDSVYKAWERVNGPIDRSGYPFEELSPDEQWAAFVEDPPGTLRKLHPASVQLIRELFDLARSMGKLDSLRPELRKAILDSEPT